ncbi:MAG TPA: penicillin-binding protein 2 [Pseudomonadales bacterium]|nr:penicillin-binding protein 2 [Pseudomonadales bacterium]
MPEPLALKDHSGESQIFFERAVAGFALLVLLTLFLVARLFYLQIVRHDVYSTLSDKNRIQVQSLAPTRGLIYDRNGELLADNIPSYSLTITVERVKDLDKTLEKIKSLIGLSADDIEAFKRRLKRRQRPFESVPILFKLTQAEIAKIGVNEYALPGVQVEASLVRHYPKGKLMAHAVGSVRRINEEDARKLDPVAYSGIDDIGKIGVEKYYETALLGKVGYERVETDARGKIMQVLDSTKPIPGKNLVLTVDTSLQQVASDALGDRRGAVVALNPRTGGILALVSKPSYDPNLFVTGIDYKTYSSLRDSPNTPLFNRAIQGQYEPGSTIKPFMGIAGLASGVINPEYTIHDPGYFKLPGSDRLYRDWSWAPGGYGGQGDVDLEKAIYRSVNVYFYNLAVKLGIDRIHDYLKEFGFGQDTVLDLPEARAGLLPSKAWKRKARGEPWYPGDTVNVGIGQGNILVTPLQLATAVAMIANRGKAIAPHMLKTGSELLEDSSVTRLKDVDRVPGWIWDLITKAMMEVVHRGNMGYGENGTAWAYIGRDIPYHMAGKSGTAQVVGIAQGEEYNGADLDERNRKHAWFVAFAPVEKPVIAVAVLVENGGGGSEYAAPVARKVIDHYLLDEDLDVAAVKR